MWISPRRLYLDADGSVVGHDNPAKLSLLVREGGELPMADAVRYGLVGMTAEAATEPVVVTEEPAPEAAPEVVPAPEVVTEVAPVEEPKTPAAKKPTAKK